MRFAYYPGCSNHATARQYEESIQAIAKPLGIELKEIPDWNCCGATAYMSINEVLAFCLTARNLSKAKEIGDPVVTPCSACYTNLRKTEAYIKEFPEIKAKVGEALAEAGMKYEGGVVAKHLLQALMQDVGLDKVRSLVRKPLAGLKVAPYYGCQIVRPYGICDDPENPTMFESLLSAIGATPTPYPMKTTCCGGSLIGTREEVALRLCRNLLMCAQADGADCIAVTCPLCQMNLDVYQQKVNEAYGTSFAIPIVYFTQLMGVAFGLDGTTLGLQRCAVPAMGLAARFA